MDNRSDIWRSVDAIKPRFVALSDKVWAMPEVCYTEARSSAEHLAELRHHGFRITENVADIPTALMGEWGEGGPVIAFLGEYDALPGLSQEAGVGGPRPVEVGGPCHGLRPQPPRRRRIGLPPTRCRGACVIMAAPPRRAVLRKPSWCAQAPSMTPTSPSPG